MDKVDFKKQYKELYQPGRIPVLVDVPVFSFIKIDGVAGIDYFPNIV